MLSANVCYLGGKNNTERKKKKTKIDKIQSIIQLTSKQER